MPQLHTRDPYAGWRELTLRGMILGALITVVFTASNVYLGLKVGLTFATSIPAAVISMAVLKFFKGSNILENNIIWCRRRLRRRARFQRLSSCCLDC